MLGRLFNSKSHSNLSDLSSFSSTTPTPTTTATSPSLHSTPSSSLSSSPALKYDLNRTEDYCDAYTRALLYGTPNSLTATPLDNTIFRIIIIQDGNIRSKSVLYDSCSLNQPQQPQAPLQQQPQSFTNKIDTSKYHNPSELADYMFGCGVPITEWSISTKLHLLPSLPKSPSSVLITRAFSLNSKFTNCKTAEKFDKDWHPQSTLPLSNSAPSKDLVRFGIGFVIPSNASDIESLITNNWEEYINFIAIFQALVISKLKLQCKINPNIYLSLNKNAKNSIDKKLSFPSHVLQNDFELQHHFNNFIKLTHSLFQIPRLLVGVKRSDATLFNWCHHVAAWLEFKDGKNFMAASRLEFLASLFAILIPIRRQLLTNKPCDKTKKITRVVIMTGNPAVVQKLIFIIVGILSNDVLAITPQDKETESPSTKSINITKKAEPSSPTGSASSATPSLVSSYSKGWEISKNTPSIPTNTITATPVNFSPSRSLESSSASLQYLSSSLSSSYNSSSWKQVSFFDKWRSSTNTITPLSNNDSAINGGQHDSSTKTVPHRRLSTYRTPSPAVEYEEYPWSNTSTMHSFQPSKISRNQSSFDLSISNNNGNSKYSANTLQHIERTPTTIKGSFNANQLYEQECKNIMTGSPQFDVVDEDNGHSFLETTSLDEFTIKDQNNEKSAVDTNLKPLVGYVEEFHPEFSLQACPFKVGLDQDIINTMKNDLIHHSYLASSSPKTVSRTIFVSLAAREIKEFQVKIMGTNATLSTSPAPNPASINDCVVVKKIFSPRKSELDNSKVLKIDNLLDHIIGVAKSIDDNDRLPHSGNGKATINGEEPDHEKFAKIRELLSEMFLVV